MGQRVVRVNELLKREISHILHTRYQAETVEVSILSVDVSPNLRSAKVFFATHGDPAIRERAERFFSRHHESIRREMAKAVTLKFLPHLEFIYDKGADYGEKLNQLLDDLGLEGETFPEPED
ncbi:30S ribosome-binding factor RbfA [Puniceicoccales bacterium CK1056]|uniref:Ribosome-binding factor A n=1 Tax=Oceanipulchritudo coccoides TaxID=2706888 RepID=A0A6B2LYP4_9BACT|nr:30S ribosome-binding factor RbfA [Oceanipulchritudo coccoides]NDV61166.1 30S ribosome-binding factor RbfA [Oceanipulchritudo coccoides]